ncbi:hypothetical protein V6N13_112710 [Hibiscus sabdariffa]
MVAMSEFEIIINDNLFNSTEDSESVYEGNVDEGVSGPANGLVAGEGKTSLRIGDVGVEDRKWMVLNRYESFPLSVAFTSLVYVTSGS